MNNRDSIYCVELKNVVKRFKTITAVDHLSINVEQGKVFSLLGPSGCGKTTTLRLIAGLEFLDEGDVLIDGIMVNDIPPYKRECSTVFQNLALFPHMTIEDNIAYGLERRKVPKPEINKRVGDMLDLMGLIDMEKRRPSQLSGGQQQRVALARSLILRPKILLLDEPLSSLDRKLRKEMQIELKRIQQEVGITFLYVTHDQKVALSISDIIAVMRDGKLEQVGSPKAIYETPRTMFIAAFMGAINIFPGKVSGGGNGKINIKTESGMTISAIESKDIHNEEISGISVHPELIDVSPRDKDAKGDNNFIGKIREIIYQGDFVEMIISLDRSDKLITAHLMRSSLYQEDQFSPGEEVLVHWDLRSSNITE